MVMPEKWDGTQMPPQHGRIGIVTGSNQGMGFACARQLAEHGMHVVLACRNEQRAQDAVHKLQQHLARIADAGKVEYMLVDLGCMASVKAFSDAVHAKFDRIDLLINNAGVGTPPERTSSTATRSSLASTTLATSTSQRCSSTCSRPRARRAS